MQKRDQNKSAGSAGGATAPAAKRGRPFGSTSSNTASASSGDTVAPSNLLGPSLQVHSSFLDQNNKRIVLALQSGLKSELTWALNTLTMLSFKEKEDMRKDSLAKIPGLLDALLQVIDDWRDIALPKELSSKPRVRTLGANSLVTGFGNRHEALGSNNNLTHPGFGSVSSVTEVPGQKNAAKENGKILPFVKTVISCYLLAASRNVFGIEDEELVTNALETIVNLAPLLDLRIFSSAKPSYIKITEKRAVQAIMGMLGSAVKAWHCAAAELLGRMIINPDNEPFLLPFVPQIHKRLVDLMSIQALDAQAAAVGALYNFAEVNMDCRLKLASERWAVDRLLKVIKTPHPVPEVCRKAAMILESLVSEPQNRAVLLAYENAFAEILFSESRYSDTFARILYELTSRPNYKFTATRGVWGV
ncbi:hypothetical protein GH714_020533 [Hevea brasiliensis]|uniref:SWI/SNF-like complex subunit BAF250 C-terminal domain-containing protein n=1 Tax=Hevea brasiliensis TaxID=3981 RepID=A0A6A6MNJ6_HEVBR|nr:hypothetical protein GH714_020533 [Hevea brasiliensis]